MVYNLQERDYILLDYLYRYQYLDLKFINLYIYKTIKSRRRLLMKMRVLIKLGYIKIHKKANVSNEILDNVIYSITIDGLELVKKKYDFDTYKTIKSETLKKGFEHNLLVNHLLFKFKDKHNSQIYSERDCFQKMGSTVKDIYRPDGAILEKNHLIIFEYEHSNLRRDIYRKLKRYENYINKQLYKYNYVFGSEEIKTCQVHLITSKNITHKKFSEIKDMKLNFLLTYSTFDEMYSSVGDTEQLNNCFKVVK